MIQDITPHKFRNEYTPVSPKEGDTVFAFWNGMILANINRENDVVSFPKIETNFKEEDLIYLFAIDDVSFFLYQKEIHLDGFQYEKINELRPCNEKYMVFAAMTAYHLYGWYHTHQFCGQCGEKTVPDENERMLRCPVCGNMTYPVIAPAVIVGVIDGDRILMTKYAGREYTRHALIAGFTEIGETLEETVKREVMEEVGLKVKHVTYYKNQPWGQASNLLVGFFAELDGTAEITLDETELAEGTWFERTELSTEDEDYSLTREMIAYFARNGKESCIKNE